VPAHLQDLVKLGHAVRPLFLDASTDTLVRRFSETRRRHPLSKAAMAVDGDQHRAVVEAIELERELLAELREHAHVVDTSVLRAAQLQEYVKSLLSAPLAQLTLVFQSFSYKRGIPVDADYVFDVRMLPNPHYEPELRALTGRDPPVVEYLRQSEEVEDMYADICAFLDHWLDALARNQRSYVTVAIGCTGGQHRSVYLVERLAEEFGQRWATLKRHREIDAA
jgi:RNase adapter protein RapZ